MNEIRFIRKGLFVFFSGLICLNGVAYAQTAAERILPERGYLPGATVKVTLNVPATPSEVTLIEILPEGWKARYCTYASEIENNKITIQLKTYSKQRTITYLASVPETAEGQYSFTGFLDDDETLGMDSIIPMTYEPLGIFENHIDLGMLKQIGTASYDDQTDTYLMTGERKSLEQFGMHCLYKKVFGDFTLQGKLSLQETDVHSAAFFIVHDDLSYDWHYYAAIVEFLDERNGDSKRVSVNIIDGEMKFSGDPMWAATTVQDGYLLLERKGTQFMMYYKHKDTGEFVLHDTLELPLMSDPVYAGIGIMSFNGYGEGVYSNVQLTTNSSISAWELY